MRSKNMPGGRMCTMISRIPALPRNSPHHPRLRILPDSTHTIRPRSRMYIPQIMKAAAIGDRLTYIGRVNPRASL